MQKPAHILAPRTKRPAWPHVVLIVLATLLVYGNLVRAGFTAWDDNFNLYGNPRLNPPTLESVAHYWLNTAHGLYVPLTYTAWALPAVAQVEPDARGVTLVPALFHGLNVLIHAAAGLAAYALLGRLVRDRRAAVLGAMLFLLHPVQVEPVGWACGTKDLLSGMFILIALWQFVAYLGDTRAPGEDGEAASDDRARSRIGAGLHYALATLAFLLALLSKPAAVVTPLMAFAIGYWLLRRPIRTLLLSLVPWLVLSAVLAVVARIAQDTEGLPGAPLWARPFIAGDALSFYLGKLLWPMSLGIDYGRTPEAVMARPWFYAAWLVPVGLGVLLWLRRREAPALWTAGVLFVLGVAPVLGLAHFQFQYFSTVADHYLYTAMIGVALAGAWLVRWLSGRFRPAGVYAVAAILLVLLGVRSALQTRVWQDDIALFSNAVEVNPRSFTALNTLGFTLSRRGQPELAEALYRESIAANPQYSSAHHNLANLLSSTGRLDEAIEHRLAAVEITRAEAPGRQELLPDLMLVAARDLAAAGRLDHARELYREYLALRPGDTEAAAALRRIEPTDE